MVLNAMDAAERGAVIRTRTRCDHARRDGDGWLAELVDGSGHRIAGRAPAPWSTPPGPWVSSFLGEALGVNSAKRVRLIKGSHIVVPRLYPGEHPYILQNDDKRIVFVIPFEGEFSLIGTTDVPYEGDPAAAAITPDETDYLCRVVNRYFKREIAPADVVWSYAGVRPLYDDASGNASAVTRDYVFDLDAGAGPRAAAVDLRRQDHDLPQARRARAGEAAAGDGLHARRLDRRRRPARRRHAGCRFRARSWPRRGASIPGCPSRCCAAGRAPTAPAWRRSSAAPAGSRTSAATSAAACTRPRSAISPSNEWARTAEDVLWRRSRLGLHVGRDTVVRLEEMLGGGRRRHAPRRRTHEPAPGPGPPHRRQRGLDRHAVARSRRPASSTCCSGRRWPARPR